MKKGISLANGLLVGAALLGVAPAASAVTRDEAMVRAHAFAYHPWHASAANMTASCAPAYKSIYAPGDYVGLPYDWGGYMSLFEFDQDIKSGYGAGAQEPDGVLDCTAGLDCSGFVSQAWAAGHFTTSSIPTTSTQITQAEMLPGDVFNKAGYHVVMLTKWLASGEPSMIESVGYNVHVNTTGGLSYVSGYIPRRYSGITGAAPGANPTGTPTNPIVIPSFPYNDSRDTKQSPSSLIDGCAAAPTIKDAGPEYVYSATFSAPGTLTVSVTNDVGADIDVLLLTQMNTSACIARDNAAVTQTVGCGTYFLVADTFGAGLTKAGHYSLTATFTPSGASCASVSGPAPFNPSGTLGSACGYPAHPELPFCNPNLGADTCIYTSTTSFCSKPCAAAGDCADMPGGPGCCEDVGSGELYCMTQSTCGSGPSVGADAGGGGDGGAGGAGGAGSDGGGGPASGDPGADPAGAGGDGAKTTTASGCTMSMNDATQGAGAFFLGLLGVGIGIARRRWRRRRWPHPFLLN